jgi:outer membrane protein assembly factor BamB
MRFPCLFALLALPLAADDADWAQWRGPRRDGISPDTGLLKSWPAGGPPLAWKATGLGGGYSSVSVAGDRVYTLGDAADACTLLALGRADGKPVWKAKVGPPAGHPKYPGPRSSPSVDGSRLYVLGQHGDLVCYEAADGKEVWRKHLERDFGGKQMSGWRWSESPLIDGDLVVVTPGGSQGAVLALKKATGETAWRSAELTDTVGYASLVPTELGGVRQYLAFTSESVAGIGAKDGKVLWRAARHGERAVITTPVHKDGLVFVSSSYGVGHNCFQVSSSGGVFKVEELYKGKELENHHGGVVLVGDHVYGTDQRSLKCVELKTGKLVWQNPCVGKGSVGYADGHLYVRGEKKGPVVLVEATPSAYREKGRLEQPQPSGDMVWPHPVVIGGRLYLRDQDHLFCYDVKAK